MYLHICKVVEGPLELAKVLNQGCCFKSYRGSYESGLVGAKGGTDDLGLYGAARLQKPRTKSSEPQGLRRGSEILPIFLIQL